MRQAQHVQERRVAPARREIEERYFTVKVGGEWFGMPVACVHTVFLVEALTRIPLAPPAITGLVNLRGRIVTAICLRARLGMKPRPPGQLLAIGIEHRGEALALVVDKAGDVLTLTDAGRIETPRHMPPARAALTESVRQLENGLVCILDLAAVFDLNTHRAAAA